MMGKILLYDTIIFFFLYSIGSLVLFLLKKQPENEYTKVFSKVLIGIVVFVVVYSIVKTCGKTINIGFLILFPFSILFLKTSPFTNSIYLIDYFKISGRTIVTIFSFMLLLFLYKAWFLIDSNYNYPLVPNVDYVFYSRMSDYFNATGNESTFLDYIHPDQNHPLPYHYFEIWFNAGITYFTNELSVLCQELSCHILFNVLICIGFLSIAENYTKITLRENLLALLLLFFNGLIFYFYPENLLHSEPSMFLFNAFTLQKTAIIYLFLIASLLFMIHKKNELAICTLLTLPLVSISSVSSILISVFLISIVSFKNKTLILQSYKIVLVTLSLAIFIFSFYFFNKGNDTIASNFGSANVLEHIVQNKNNFFSFINIIGKSGIQIMYIYLPFVVILCVYYKKVIHLIKSNPFVLIFVLIVLFAIVSWSATDLLINSGQLFSNISIPILNIIFLISFHFTIVKYADKRISICCYSLFLLWMLVNIKNTTGFLTLGKNKLTNSYSDKYLNEVAKTIQPMGNRGGFIGNNSDFSTIFSKNLNVYAYRDYLVHVKKDLDILPLNYKAELPLNTDPNIKNQEEKMTERFSFCQFIEGQKTDKTFVNIAQSRIDFIEKYTIKFLFLTKGTVIDTVIQKKITKTIEDPVSGETMVILN